MQLFRVSHLSILLESFTQLLISLAGMIKVLAYLLIVPLGRILWGTRYNLVFELADRSVSAKTRAEGTKKILFRSDTSCNVLCYWNR